MTKAERTEETASETEIVTGVVTTISWTGKETATVNRVGRDYDSRGGWYRRRDDYHDNHRSSRDHSDRDYSHRLSKYYKDYDMDDEVPR